MATGLFNKTEHTDQYHQWKPQSDGLRNLGNLREEVSRKRYTTLDSLEAALERAWKGISTRILTATTKNFKKRLEACIAADGGHFEQTL
uniref:Reverse transcriptase n=1 Tax=Steinernema glaseri TaxID=37863 RepID=A0A1I7YQ37_9BILA